MTLVSSRVSSTGPPTPVSQPQMRRARPSRAPRATGWPAALARLVVRDEVEVGARVAGHRRADARGEDVLPALAAGDAEDHLSGVDPSGEVEQGDRDVVADDVGEGAAQFLDQAALRSDSLGDAEVRPSLLAMYTTSTSPPAPFSAERAARRISVRPSGPPVRPTMIRSREPQIFETWCSLRYCRRYSSTRSASRGGPARSAVRFPGRK